VQNWVKDRGQSGLRIGCKSGLRDRVQHWAQNWTQNWAAINTVLKGT
jgi:hypothetical protein